jgi:hypothetical protein
MVTSIIAGGDGPTVTDWVTMAATVVATLIALVAMVVSIGAARDSKRDAAKAADALKTMATAQNEIARAQGEISQTGREEAEHGRRTEARGVAIVKDVYKNREGIAVRNGNRSATIRDLKVDFRSSREDHQFDPLVVVHSAKGTETVAAPWTLASLEPGDTTAHKRVLQKAQGTDDLHSVLDLTRIRFKDSRNTWWQAIGTEEPVQIPGP